MFGLERQNDSPWPHLWSLVLVCSTFPLIWVGGLVTTTKAGMAVPDWPTTYGYNMFLYPWTTWIFGPWDLFIEHGHRLLGALVGGFTIAFVLSVYLAKTSTELKWAAWVALSLVVLQGVLGGMRVRLDRLSIAMIHGCVGPLFFAYCCVVTEWTRRGSNHVTQIAQRFKATPGLWKGFRLSLLTSILVYLQIILGAQIRHAPVSMSPRTFQLVVWLHLTMAAAVVGHVFLLAKALQESGTDFSLVRRPLIWLIGLVVIQVVLGAWSWIVRRGWPAWFADWSIASSYLVQVRNIGNWLIPTAHTAFGSLILGCCSVLTTRTGLACLYARSVTDNTKPTHIVRHTSLVVEVSA